MHQPAHIEGKTVVMLSRRGSSHAVIESGRLAFDGEDVSLVTAEAKRLFSPEEIDSLVLVVAGNRIPECLGFDFFTIRSEAKKTGQSATANALDLT
jgi:hypothetical protein